MEESGGQNYNGLGYVASHRGMLKEYGANEEPALIGRAVSRI